ncbi:hypothetical protein ACFWPK_30795 [Nocardia sp. NPDC058519]|uniref:hypothetical protein n=1 Tax=unclassified Nocardia TaxID=2637762 RepID=UPI00365B5A48
MSTDSQSERHGHDGFAEFTEELRLLSEVLLARVEPVLRRTAADGRADLGGCAWCPVCAAAALVRGDHHDVVAALAEHGTSMVTVLREALAGIPVEPVLPQEWADHAAGHPDSTERPSAPRESTSAADATGNPSWGTTRSRQPGAPRPRRVDEFTEPHQQGPPPRTTPPTVTPEPSSGTDAFATARAPRSQYVDIPVTIRG